MFKLFVSMFFLYLALSFLGDILDALQGVEKTTIYERYCTDSKVDVFDCEKNGGTIRFSKSEFRIDFKNQLVVEKDSYFKYSDCIVFDKDNWNCGYSTNSDAWVSMHEGSYSASSSGEFVNGKFVSGKIVVHYMDGL